MSNNKQIMKLYTEEQLHSTMLLALGRHGIYIPNKHYQDLIDLLTPIDEDLIDLLTPIELPSDEEIDAHVEDDFLNATEVHKYSEEAQLLMKAMCKAGALWMRDKIQGGNI